MSKGITYILIASLFFALINGLVKFLKGIPAIEIVFFRSMVTLILSGALVLKNKEKIFPKETPLLLARGVAGGIALILYFNSIHMMPLATAVTILYLAPIFTLIFAIFLLKESPDKRQWPFIILCFVGIVLMKNYDERVSLIGVLMATIAAMFAGLAYNIIRMLKGKASTQLVIFYFPLVTIPLCLPWLIPQWKSPSFSELCLLILIGLATQVAQVFMTKAYMLEPASKITHFNYLTSFYAWLTGIIFFNEYLNTLSLIGLSFVFIGIYFSTKFSSR
ncbi:MAG: EamA family transporter [Halobacteriovoraceae bacterium]|nr:EamA family transporter [Halobacteriovoraceae bacterium]|tara:strand:+ start:3653 stop:4483 length:831 start_codon:yes stop_codon:yes gene_type:complete